MEQIKVKDIVEVPVTEVVDGEVVYNMGADMASADPFRYGRLVRAGKLKEAEKMEQERGHKVLLENGEFL